LNIRENKEGETYDAPRIYATTSGYAGGGEVTPLESHEKNGRRPETVVMHSKVHLRGAGTTQKKAGDSQHVSGRGKRKGEGRKKAIKGLRIGKPNEGACWQNRGGKRKNRCWCQREDLAKGEKTTVRVTDRSSSVVRD